MKFLCLGYHACLSVDHILCIQKVLENHWGLKIRIVWKGSHLKQQSSYHFVVVSGSSYGHPQSVEYPRSRSAQKNPSTGFGSCLVKKCGGGKIYITFVSLHCFLFFGKIWDFLQIYLIFSAACDCSEEGSD